MAMQNYYFLQQDNQQNIVKDAKLLPKISPNEGFEGKATVPIEIQENYNYNLELLFYHHLKFLKYLNMNY